MIRPLQNVPLPQVAIPWCPFVSFAVTTVLLSGSKYSHRMMHQSCNCALSVGRNSDQLSRGKRRGCFRRITRTAGCKRWSAMTRALLAMPSLSCMLCSIQAGIQLSAGNLYREGATPWRSISSDATGEERKCKRLISCDTSSWYGHHSRERCKIVEVQGVYATYTLGYSQRGTLAGATV